MCTVDLCVSSVREGIHPPDSNRETTPDRECIMQRMTGTSVSRQSEAPLRPRKGYDPELLMVECGRCGRPLLWEKGRATRIVTSAGIDPATIDEHCMILAEACPQCQPGKSRYDLTVIRVGEVEEHDPLRDEEPRGTA